MDWEGLLIPDICSNCFRNWNKALFGLQLTKTASPLEHNLWLFYQIHMTLFSTSLYWARGPVYYALILLIWILRENAFLVELRSWIPFKRFSAGSQSKSLETVLVVTVGIWLHSKCLSHKGLICDAIFRRPLKDAIVHSCRWNKAFWEKKPEEA